MVGRSLHRQGILDCIAGSTGEGESSRVRMGGARASGADLSETPTNLVAHLFAELLPAGGCLSFSGILNRSKTSNFLFPIGVSCRRRRRTQGRTISPCPPRTTVCRSHHRDPRGAVSVRRRSLGQIQAGVPARSGRVPAAENSSLPAGRQHLPTCDFRHRGLRRISIGRHPGVGDLFGDFRLRARERSSSRNLLRGRFHLGKRLARRGDQWSACQDRQSGRDNSRQAGINHKALGPFVSRFDADD